MDILTNTEIVKPGMDFNTGVVETGFVYSFQPLPKKWWQFWRKNPKPRRVYVTMIKGTEPGAKVLTAY